MHAVNVLILLTHMTLSIPNALSFMDEKVIMITIKMTMIVIIVTTVVIIIRIIKKKSQYQYK